jgi:hypothetical protein
MSSNKDDTTQKKVQAWSAEEHNILVRMTNEQIAVEAKDHSRMIPWAEHWRNVSSCLRKHGYIRTTDACRIYSRRVIESQDANTQFAAQESGGNPAGTAIPGSVNLDYSNSNKRPLPQEMDIPSEEGSSPSSKKHRWRDIVCGQVVENIQVSLLIPD